MTGDDETDVRLAVVVPVHRQPQFLAGAVMSALGQDAGPAGVVIVNDGCPFPSTERIALELRAAHPGRVRYLSLSNRGVAAARNAGVREALVTWPAVEAVFPLDADNRLSPYTLGHLQRTLLAHPGASWAYPALERFGGETGIWETSGAFSAYRQLFENQCDVGSLIARTVFDGGMFFDEGMREGYEDWEFFARAASAGLRGVPAGRCGFRYRDRGRSMLRTARVRHEALYAELRARHAEAFAPRRLTRLEHEDLPRFALVSSDRGEVLLTSCADLPPRIVSPEALATAVESGDAPPVTIVGTAGLWSVLGEAGLLPGVLLRAQEVVRRHPVAGLVLAPGSVELTERAPSGRPVHALIAKTATALDSWEPDLELELRLPWPELPGTLPRVPAAAPREGPAGASNTGFALLKHVDRLETTFPHTGGPGRALWVVADAARAPRAVALASALPGGGAVHLALTGGAFAGDGTATITLLADLERDAGRRLLAAAIGSADVVVVAGAALGYEALALLEGAPLRIALEDVPVPALRDVEDLVDVALATSERAAHRLENLDVVPDKIVVVDLGDPDEAARRAARALEHAARPVAA